MHIIIGYFGSFRTRLVITASNVLSPLFNLNLKNVSLISMHLKQIMLLMTIRLRFTWQSLPYCVITSSVSLYSMQKGPDAPAFKDTEAHRQSGQRFVFKKSYLQFLTKQIYTAVLNSDEPKRIKKGLCSSSCLLWVAFCLYTVLTEHQLTSCF